MKLKNLFIVGLLAFAAATTTASAQSYKTAFGARLGYDNGLTLKHFMAPATAVEGLLYFSKNYFVLTGLYEYQQPLPGAPGLDWYVGIGAHLGSLHGKVKKEHKSYFLAGADLIGGLEYTFPTAPFNVSLDWKPSFNFVNDYNDGWYYGLALSLRYTYR